MRIVFMGTAELACPCLEALAQAHGHVVEHVVTQPDRPQGRRLQPAPPPVKRTAIRLGLPVSQPERIREPFALEPLRALAPELIVVVAYGQFLPATLLELPTRGCINVHASLLPRWRGAAPIQYAILHGDRETGVSTMFLSEEMDAGDVILQRRTPIEPDDTSGILHDRLARLGAALLVETVARLADGTAPRTPQDPAAATYARKITKDQGRVDWNRPAEAIERQVRAFDPWPGTSTGNGERLLKIWKTAVVPAVTGAPGTLVEADVVATGRGGLRLLEVQPAGGKRMSFADYRHGHSLAIGDSL